MRYLAVTDDDLLFELMGGSELEEDSIVFLTDDANLKKRIGRRGAEALSGDLAAKRTYERARVDDDCLVVFLLEDQARLLQACRAVREAAEAVPLVALATGPDQLDRDLLREELSDLEVLELHSAFQHALRRELRLAATRRLVGEYQADFSQADRVLILVHGEPDPDSLGSALALRTLLGRDRRTAIIGTPGTFTRPENVQMAHMLDIQVENITPPDLERYDRVALVDAQLNLFQGLTNAADLVIDHHPRRTGYAVRFEDIRPQLGATATIMVEHMEAAGVSISERLATALLYAIKSDTLFLQRNTSRQDVEAFSRMYRLADPAAVRKIEGAGVSLEHLGSMTRALDRMKVEDGLFLAHVGRVDREDFVPYLAEYFLEMQEVEWAAVSGIVGKDLILSVRNLGYQRSAGKLVKELFDDVGSAGGHRAAAKAIIPMKTVREKAGSGRHQDITAWIWKLFRRATQ